jgi:pimeloyl-ACP methyl ester carboxylesterase
MKRRVGAIELGYDVDGSGAALVLVHAFPLDRRMWSETARALAASRRVIALDLRGFGESSLGTEAITIETYADDVARLLDALGVPMAALCGLSLGGYVALAFAARHPARLARLVLADTRAGADSPDGKRGRDDGIARVRALGAAAFVEPMPARLLSPRAGEALRDRVRALGAAQAPDAIAAALVAMRDRPDRTGELAAIDCPTLIMVGHDDALTPPAEAHAMAAHIRGARVVELDAAGHLSNLEAPDAFAAALASFLDEN